MFTNIENKIGKKKREAVSVLNYFVKIVNCFGSIQVHPGRKTLINIAMSSVKNASQNFLIKFTICAVLCFDQFLVSPLVSGYPSKHRNSSHYQWNVPSPLILNFPVPMFLYPTDPTLRRSLTLQDTWRRKRCFSSHLCCCCCFCPWWPSMPTTPIFLETEIMLH